MSEKDKQRLAMFDAWMEANYENNKIVILADEVCELWEQMQEADVLPEQPIAK